MIKTCIRPAPNSPHLFPAIEGYVRCDVSWASRKTLNGARLSSLAPENIANVVDYEGNICGNLNNFMEFIKVFPFKGHEQGNEPSTFWRDWKLRGFAIKKKIVNPRTHAYCWDGYRIENEAEYFKELYMARVRELPAFIEIKKLIEAGQNVMLLDFDMRVMPILVEMLGELPNRVY